MKSDLIHTDAVLDRLPIHGTIEAVDELVTDTVPDIVTAGAASGRRTLRHVSQATSRLSLSGWLLVGTAAAVLITLVIWRRRTADRPSASWPEDGSATKSSRRAA